MLPTTLSDKIFVTGKNLGNAAKSNCGNLNKQKQPGIWAHKGAKTWTRRETRQLGRPRPYERYLVLGLRENRGRFNQLEFDLHIAEVVVGTGNGGEASLYAPPIVNKMLINLYLFINF